MSADLDRQQLLSMLEEIGRVKGVRGALIATVEGAFHSGKSNFDAKLANDLSRTVRRMVVASATVGAPLAELLINFGPARMMVVPIREEATLAVLLERDTVTATVRSLLKIQLSALRHLFGNTLGDPGESTVNMQAAEEPEDEVDRLMAGDLGPVLRDVEACFTSYLVRAGKSRGQAQEQMREQMREWLLCCNPSPYTFPLLIDGLAQLIGTDQEERATFMQDVQDAMRNSGVWNAKAAR